MLSQLSELKNKLALLEENFSNKIENVTSIEKKWESFEEKIKEIENTKEEDIIWINVGGKKFATKLNTLLNVKDNLFHKIIINKKLDVKKGIFIDRSSTYFPVILDYFRYGKFDIKKFTKEQLMELKEEITYYEVLPLEEELSRLKNEFNLEYTSLEVSMFYNGYDGEIVGSRDVKVLLDKNLNTGICTDTPAWMIVGFNDEYEFDEIEIGGFTGDPNWIWSEGYEANARIETSMDKVNWKLVGLVPPGFGQTIITTKVTNSTAKFIKLTGTNWLGIGYLRIKV